MPPASWTRIELLRAEGDPGGMGRRTEIACLALMLVLGGLLRVWWANATPLHPDEIHYAHDFLAPQETGSLAAVRDVSCAFLVERRTAHPALVSLATRWLWVVPFGGFFEHSPGFLRGFNVLCGILLIPLAWWTARATWSPRHGIAAGWLVAVSPLLAWVARTAYLDPPFVLLVGGFLATALHARRGPGLAAPLLTGLFAGLAASCKISGALLAAPLLVGTLMGPASLTARDRILRAGACLLAAGLTWLALCSPEAYFNAILNPTDPRYARMGEYPPLVFLLTELVPYRLSLLLGAPLPLLLAPLLVLPALRARRGMPDALLGTTMVSFLPLFVLHTPSFSGPHGLAPLLLVGALWGSRVVEYRLPVLVPLALLHGGLAVAGLLAPLHAYLVPFGRPVDDDSMAYRKLRPWLFDRRSPPRIAITGRSGDVLLPMETLMRNATLLEGAIFLVPADGEDPLVPGPWQVSDAVLVPRALLAEGVSVPEEFREAATLRGVFNGVLYVRTSGRPMKEFPVRDLAPARKGPQESRLLPGSYYPVTGRVLLDGEDVPVEGAEKGPLLDGFRNAYDWGDGWLVLPESDRDGEGVVTFGAPRREDVFWDF